MDYLLQIDGMHCGGCERAVRTALTAVSGVDAVDVSLASGSARVSTARPVETGRLIAALEDAGYEAVLTPAST